MIRGKDAFPPPPQSLRATKFRANPLPMIAVTQTGIMGVVSAPFSSNTIGALSTPPPHPTDSFFALFIRGQLRSFFPSYSQNLLSYVSIIWGYNRKQASYSD